MQLANYLYSYETIEKWPHPPYAPQYQYWSFFLHTLTYFMYVSIHVTHSLPNLCLDTCFNSSFHFNSSISLVTCNISVTILKNKFLSPLCQILHRYHISPWNISFILKQINQKHMNICVYQFMKCMLSLICFWTLVLSPLTTLLLFD